MSCNRKAEYRLYPTLAQAKELERICAVAAECYNLALAERKYLYHEWGISLGFSQQCSHIKLWRASRPHWQEVHVHVLQVALKRLDLAFAHFFRRLKTGETPGFPRYKKADRFSGFGFKEHGNGWAFLGNKIRLHGVGELKIRGKTRHLGKPATVEVFRRAGKWFASVTLRLEALPHREHGAGEVGLDWGVQSFATLAHQDGCYSELPNPRHLKKSLNRLKVLQRAVARRQKGSVRREKKKRAVQKLFLKVANQRKDFCHQTANRLVKQNRLIAIEKLNVQSMVQGKGKASLHRSILDATPNLFHQLLKCKAEEAGTCQVVEIEPLHRKPSQTCHVSGRVERKELFQRTHLLPSGELLSRDRNSARVLLQFAWGWEPSPQGEGWLRPSTICETSPTFVFAN